MFRRTCTTLLAALAALLLASPGPTAEASPPTVVAGRVLIYGPSLAGGGARFNEATAARSLGFVVAIADKVAWRALTTDDFAKYDAVIVGDRGCAEGRRYLRLAAATREVWTPAVAGNVAVLGSDPVYHARRDEAGARQLILNGVQYAASGDATGAYLALGCAFVGAPAGTPVGYLSGFGAFTAHGQRVDPLTSCPNRATIVDPTSPLVADLEDSDLSGWTCSIHEAVDGYPVGFQPVAVERRSALPYLLSRPPTVTPPPGDVAAAPGSTSWHVTAADPNHG